MPKGEHRIRVSPTPHDAVVLVCRKCAKKLKGGFGPDQAQSLPRAIKHRLRQDGRRTVRVVETKCLGLCPSGAVTVLSGSNPGVLLSVPRGADPVEVLTRLAAAPPP